MASAYSEPDRIRSAVAQQDIENSCLGCHETTYGLVGAETLEAGRNAFATYACYACHQARGFMSLSKFGPPLEDLGAKIFDRRWISAWLRNPQSAHPGAIMPDFKLSDAERRDVVALLFSLSSEREYPPLDLSVASAERGERLFTMRGCKACHADVMGQPSHRRRVPDLFDAGVKLNPGWVIFELEVPRLLNPDSRVPRMKISAAETMDIIAYLTTLRNASHAVNAEPRVPAPGSPERGRQVIASYGCYGCHRVTGFETMSMPGPDLSFLAEALTAEAGGNSAARLRNHRSILDKILTPRKLPGARMPEFTFDEGDAEDLTVFVLNNYLFRPPMGVTAMATRDQRAGQAGEEVIIAFNCRACHPFAEGESPRIQRFVGRKSLFPPRLINEGEKARPNWAKAFLREPSALRPWLDMRMPQFFLAEEQVNALIEYFSVAADSPELARLPYEPPFRREEIPQIEFSMGEYRVRFDRCMQCHPATLEGAPSPDIELEDLAINLMLAKERLRFEWVKHFLRNPDRYVGPGTRMPYIYYSPDGVPNLADAELWVDYVAKYLMMMETPPDPLIQRQDETEHIDWTHFSY
jgi:mono/diheme cytochrome c family protein